MGCATSSLLNNEEADQFTQIGSSVLGHHFVSLTSTSYGLLNLDPPSSTAGTPLHRLTLGTIFNTPSISDQSTGTTTTTTATTTVLSQETPPEVINSWELMSGLNDTDSFRFSPIPQNDQENSNPNLNLPDNFTKDSVSFSFPFPNLNLLERFQLLPPPNGENRVVIYTTTLRGIRKTFESCNLVRSGIESYGVEICERDMSMDRGFREELRKLMSGRVSKEESCMVPPRVFIKGRYVGGCEEVMRVIEEGLMGVLLQGVPKKIKGNVCEGCGDVKFLPCFSCNGSCKIVKEEFGDDKECRSVVVRCGDCNENGLMLCPICS